MSHDQGYPTRQSDVEVQFTDGTIETYRITAGSGISVHLAKQIGETGVLVLLGGAKTYSIPVGQIRQWTITELAPEKDETK